MNNTFQKSKRLGDIIVFDIGGTWFRSGIYNNESKKLTEVSKQPAKNYKNTKFTSINELQNLLVQYIDDEIERLKSVSPNKDLFQVAISMGAALNAHTGFVYNSGPLWGPGCKLFDLEKSLKRAIPECDFSIINDVSAALIREIAQEDNKSFSKIMLITISTGIACRIFDVKKNTIPVDKEYGLQGEIGHIPTQFIYDNHIVSLMCDCGGENHLNAFSSGRGIVQVIKSLAISTYKSNDQDIFNEFADSLNKGSESAFSILDAIVKPIADILLLTFTLDPEIEKVIFTGGVIHSLRPHYMKSLHEQLNKKGMYQITTIDPDFFTKRLFEGKDDDNSGLIGAALGLNIK